ncbi:MAG: hypothetical protein IPP02_00885 [Chitinophagaceae bacterium]|nr:hypothetical protein [Chitinophagaceae bacterium]
MKKKLIKYTLLSSLSLVLSLAVFSQKILPTDLKKLRAKEDTLMEYSLYLNTDSLPEDRMISDSIFTKTLVRALQIKNSFITHSILYWAYQNFIPLTHLSGFSPGISLMMIIIPVSGALYNSALRMVH